MAHTSDEGAARAAAVHREWVKGVTPQLTDSVLAQITTALSRHDRARMSDHDLLATLKDEAITLLPKGLHDLEEVATSIAMKAISTLARQDEAMW